MAKSLEHLLGGYATNTLTDKEKRQLSEAALKDQALFDALADEEGLKALLADQEARQRILASLQAPALLEGPSSKGVSRWGWFRQQSSLAWAGSIAAMGLALIFGWQMEKEWGPMVQQEQEAAKLSTRDEVAFRQEKPPIESRELFQTEALKRKADQVEGVEAGRAVGPEPSSSVGSPRVDRLRQVPPVAKKENDALERSPEARRPAINEQVAQAPASSSVPKQQRFDRQVQPSATPEAPELVPSENRAPQGAARGRLAAKVTEEVTLQPSTRQESAQELFYAPSGFLADEVMAEKKKKNKADQDFSGGLSKTFKPSSREKALTLPMEQELSEEAAAPTAKGIRYSFVRQTKEGKDEEVDGQRISGSWKEIRLAVESNVSGYLYMLAPSGNGKWQKLEPNAIGQTGKLSDGIKVKSFQRVEFSLSQLTNSLGNPIVSSLTVLLAQNPIDDLGQWLGSEVDVPKLKFERAEGAVFVVGVISEPNEPFTFKISLEDLK